MAETVKAKLRRVVGGCMCQIRGRHALRLVEVHEEKFTVFGASEHLVANRAACRTCWQIVGD